MIIIPGPASPKLGAALSDQLGLDPKPVEYRLFPDGESYIRLTVDVDDKNAVLVQTTAPDPDRKLMQLLITSKTIKDLGARRLLTIVPYLAYMRQDKRFLNGEALSFDVVIGLLESVGVDELVVVDLHSVESLKNIQPNHKINVHTLSAIPAIARYLKEHGYDGAYSLSPDEGRKEAVSKASEIMNGGFGFFEKIRDRHSGETTMKVKDFEVEGRKAVVFDDIISSGGTMAKAIENLKLQGATKVAAACTHALLMPGAEKRLNAAGADLIVATDTIETNYSKVTVAGLLADYLRTF
jgi:ribose-phosphate pyrophosphokinase